MNGPNPSSQPQSDCRRLRRPQSGFTLVELMIAMVIGLFIVLALLTLLINVNRNNGELTKTNRVIENGRFALQLLEADVSHAGFWGGFLPAFDDLTTAVAPTDAPDRVPDPCAGYSQATWNASPSTLTGGTVSYVTDLIGIPVQSYAVTTPTLSIPVCASKMVNLQPNTDVLFVRHLDTEDCVPGASCPASATDLYFQRNRCLNSSSPGYSTTTYVFGSGTTAFNLYQRDCTAASAGTLAPLRKYVSNVYYIRNYADTAGDGIPTLVRSQFGPVTVGGVTSPQYQAEQAFIPGIDGFQVELGVDDVSATGATLTTASFGTLINFPNTPLLNKPSNRGDGYPDGAYVHCTVATPCTAFQFMNTVAVKIYVLVRSESRTPGYTDNKTYQLGSTTLGPFNDSYKRHLFTQTVRLVNVSGRRETPPS